MRSIVLDTNIFHAANINFSDASSVLHLFLLKDCLMLCFDHETKIYGEYMKQSCVRLIQLWFKELNKSKNRIEYASSDLNDDVRYKLNCLGFHEESDQAFVGLAINASAAIVTEDSDYGKGCPERARDKQDVLRYLEEFLSLGVYDYSEAVNKINSL
ncbi:MAG: hypothetical protein K2Q03_04285 [Sphingobacteriaceae bacterium]|nr:hypothetical protein [Sphingobacteriaceae bacterium]